MKKTTVTIVIPTYNERENILFLIPAIKKIEKKLKGYRLEIMVVDDNSPDRTGTSLRKTYGRDPWVRVIIRKNQRGLGTAIRDGIKAAKGRNIIGMDADFNHDPGCIPNLLQELNLADLVICSRFIPGGGMQDKKRYWGTRMFNLLLRTLLKFPSTDNASGYYAIRAKDLVNLGIGKIYYGYGDYHLRLVYSAKVKGLRIAETPVYYGDRRFGTSKSNLLSMSYTYLAEAIRLRFSKNKW